MAKEVSQDYTLEAFQANTIGLNPGLISIRMSSGSKFGVEDVLSGSELLGYEYQEIRSAGSYLYAYKDGEWEIYEIICEE